MSRRVVSYFVLVIFFFLFNFYFRPISGNPLIDNEYLKSTTYINDLYKSDELFKEKLLEHNEYFICRELYDIHGIHYQGKMTLCNWILKWQKK